MSSLFHIALPAMVMVMLHGCVDTSPVDFQVPIKEGGLLDDASAILGEGGLAQACRKCMTREDCADEYEACLPDDKCRLATECWLDRYCFNYDVANLANLPLCTIECALSAGLIGQDDPSVRLIAPVIRCAQNECGAVCNVQ